MFAGGDSCKDMDTVASSDVRTNTELRPWHGLASPERRLDVQLLGMLDDDAAKQPTRT